MTDVCINIMTVALPQASPQATNGAANLVHTWTDYCKHRECFTVCYNNE